MAGFAREKMHIWGKPDGTADPFWQFHKVLTRSHKLLGLIAVHSKHFLELKMDWVQVKLL